MSRFLPASKRGFLGVYILLMLLVLGLAGCTPSDYIQRAGQEDTPEGLFPEGGASIEALPGLLDGSAPASTPTATQELAADSAATEPARQVLATPTPIILPQRPSNPLPGIQLSDPYKPEKMQLVQEAGAHWTKRNALIWSVVEPVEGTYNWGNVASLEEELADAAAQGLEMILVVQGTPIWAQELPGIHCGPISPDKLAAFGDFLSEAVRRYSAPPFNVRYWEVWNEPDASWQRVNPAARYGCWGDGTAPYFGGPYFGEMLEVVYPRMKEANPEVQVLLGGLLLDCDPLAPPEDPAEPGALKDCTSSTFLEGVLQMGDGAYFDGVSFHAYDLYYGEPGDYRNPNWHSSWDTTGPVLIAKARYLRALLDNYGYEDKYLLNTEGALLCGSTGTEPQCLNSDYSETKTSYLVQSMAAAQAEGLRANIWYSLSGWRGSQLIEGNQNIPNDSYRAFATTVSFLDEAAYIGPVSDSVDAMGYRFLQGDQEIWLVWSVEDRPLPVALPEEPDGVYNLFGEAQPAGQSLPITRTPVWVVFPG